MCDLQEMASHTLCRRMELKDLLPKEMQRLTKYPLLIDSLLKHTSRKYRHILASCCVSWMTKSVTMHDVNPCCFCL